MRGQFLIISSVVIGLILISTATAISNIRTTGFSSDETAYFVHTIKDEAEKVDNTAEEERENFRWLLNTLDTYESTTRYWRQENCLNVTLERSGDTLNLRCIG